MGKVTIRGGEIHYNSIGQGEDVVLLHGLATNQGFWSPAVLMPLVRRCRVTLMDLRGHGHSSMPPGGYSSKELAGDLHALLHYLGIKKATIIGHSFGGVVALHSAVLFPDLVERMVLADTRIRAFQPHLSSKEVLQNKIFAKKLSVLGLKLPEDEQETGLWLLEQLARSECRGKAELLQKSQLYVPFGGWKNSQNSRAAKKWLQLMENTSARSDFQKVAGLNRESIATIDKPMLVICGGNSRAVQTLQALNALVPFCQTEIIPDVGHFFPLTHPSEFIMPVLHFLQSSKNRRRRERFAMNLPISLQLGTIHTSLALIKNASLDGMLLECGLRLPVGSRIQIVTKANTDIGNIDFQAEIVRVFQRSQLEKFHYGVKKCTHESGYGTDWQKFIEGTSCRLN